VQRPFARPSPAKKYGVSGHRSPTRGPLLVLSRFAQRQQQRQHVFGTQNVCRLRQLVQESRNRGEYRRTTSRMCISQLMQRSRADRQVQVLNATWTSLRSYWCEKANGETGSHGEGVCSPHHLTEVATEHSLTTVSVCRISMLMPPTPYDPPAYSSCTMQSTQVGSSFAVPEFCLSMPVPLHIYMTK